MQFNKENFKKMMKEVNKELSEEARREMELARKYNEIMDAADNVFPSGWTLPILIGSSIGFAIYSFGIRDLFFLTYVMIVIIGCLLIYRKYSCLSNRLLPISWGDFMLKEDKEAK